MNIQFEWRSGVNCYVAGVRFGSIFARRDRWYCAINLPGLPLHPANISNNYFPSQPEARAAFERRVTAWFEQLEPAMSRTGKRSAD